MMLRADAVRPLLVASAMTMSVCSGWSWKKREANATRRIPTQRLKDQRKSVIVGNYREGFLMSKLIRAHDGAVINRRLLLFCFALTSVSGGRADAQQATPS